MAGTAEQKTGYKVADAVEKKSWWVGGAALLVGLLVPELSAVAIGVAAWEGAQIVGAEFYKQRQKAQEMKPGVQYALAA